MREFDLVIIGGGASGLMAGISAKRHYPDKKILILEKQKYLLNKVRASGNGRCNISNHRLRAEHYFSLGRSEKQKNKLVQTVLNQFSYQDLEKQLQDMGIFLRLDHTGRAYPYPEQAELVVEIFSEYINKLGIPVETLCEVHKVENYRSSKRNFKLHLKKYHVINSNKKKNRVNYSTFVSEEILCNKIIFACGSKASENLGGSDLGYKLLEAFQVPVTELRPGLVALVLENDKDRAKLNGQRFKGKASLYENTQFIFETEGEFLFTDQGLSGIAAMEMARFIGQQKHKKYHLQLDFVSHLDKKQLDETFKNHYRFFQIQEQKTYADLAKSFVRKNIAEFIEKKSTDYQSFLQQLKGYSVEVVCSSDASKAQIMAGGVDLNQINIPGFNLKQNNNLYICGELLDVDGRTGGYNLHWAWASGFLAGQLRD